LETETNKRDIARIVGVHPSTFYPKAKTKMTKRGTLKPLKLINWETIPQVLYVKVA